MSKGHPMNRMPRVSHRASIGVEVEAMDSVAVRAMKPRTATVHPVL